jgi:hypothetical protein
MRRGLMARDFPGSNSNYLSITNPAGTLDITGTALTIAAWVRVDAFASASRAIASKYGSGTGDNQYILYVNSSGKLVCEVGDSGGVDRATGATTVTTSAWLHTVGRKNGVGASALQVFLNGVTDATASSNRSIQDTTDNFVIGNGQANAFPFDGRIAEVALWNVALTAAEIAALAKGVSPLLVRPKNLAAYYPLWGVGAAGEPDLSGNAQALTETGTVGVLDHAPVGPPVLV